MNERLRFKEIFNYALFYDHGNLENLSQFQAVIVEPLALNDEDLAFLHSRNTLVIAYLSVMEISPQHESFALLESEDFIVKQGKMMMQESYGNYLLNINSPRWRGLLYHKAGRLLLKDGYDGLFLDTVGDVENFHLPSSAAHIKGMIEVIAELRKRFPDAIFIQNNGLEIICDHTASYLDGIIWENAPIGISESKLWVQNISDKLNQLRDQYGVRVMLLFEDPERSNRVIWAQRRSFADTNNYLIYSGERHYLGQVNLENR